MRKSIPHLYKSVHIALGANLESSFGVPFDTVRASLRLLEADGFSVTAQSRMFRTPCFPAGAGPDYTNACATLQVPDGAEPQDVLRHLHRVEAACGRQRLDRWGARTADLDLLTFGSSVLPDMATFARWRDLPPAEQIRQTPDRLIVPHPRLQDRAFVLVPLCDIAPEWQHPVSGQTVAQMCANLPQEMLDEITPIDGLG